MSTTRPYCLTIAGFDPSGGAGIIADCKTFEQLKVNGLSVITSNTIQTEDHFFSYNWIETALILEQITQLLDRYPIRFIKIGLIKDAETILAILNLIHLKIVSPFIIWDPILSPTYIEYQKNDDRFQLKLDEIIKHISIITPNLPEFSKLFGEKISKMISLEYSVILYLKGGHSIQKGKDNLYVKDKEFTFNPKIKTDTSKHGTGCIFSSALLSYLSREFALNKACLKAKGYVEKRIISNKTLLAYHK